MSKAQAPSLIRTAKIVLHAILACGLVHVTAGHDLGLSSSALNVIAISGVLAWSWILRKDLHPLDGRGLGPLLVLIGLATFVQTDVRELRVGAAMLTVLGMMRMLRPSAPLPSRAIAHGTLMLSAFTFAVTAMPAAYLALTQLTMAWSGALGDTFSVPHKLGPTPFGFWALASAGLLLVARHGIVDRAPKRLLLGVGWLVLLHHALVAAMIVGPAAFRSSEALTRAPWVFLLIEVGFAAALLGRPPRVALVASRRRTVAATTLAVAAAALLATPALFPLVEVPAQPRVVFFGAANQALLDWDVPEHGRHGAYSQGMFGLLPHYLREDGYDVEILEATQDPSIDLQDVDLLVAINPDRQWTESELKRIWGFVHDGGTLLVLGDHTDVGGTRACENGLLAPVSIEFNYDAALGPKDQGWRGAWALPHPLSNLGESCAHFGIGVGASLRIDATTATPLLLSRFGFSDLGDQTARERAFLGDYSYSPGERAGDIVLAAYAPFGRGRMVVFGDTSGFQNVSLAHTWDPLLRSTFRWLAGKVVFDLGILVQALALIGALLLGLAWFWSRGSLLCVGGAAFLLLLVPQAGRTLTLHVLDQPAFDTPAAVFDLSHGPRVDSRSGAANEVSGIISDLHRYGLFVKMPETLDATTLENAQVFVTIAPVMAYDAAEIALLERFVEQGGLVVVACGFEHKDSVDGLLERFGLDLSPQAIGRIPYMQPEGRLRLAPEFVHAWPVIVGRDRQPPESQDLTIYNQFQDLPTVVACWRGKGGLVLIADSFFFSADNYASLRATCLPNLRLMQSIVRDCRKRSKRS